MYSVKNFSVIKSASIVIAVLLVFGTIFINQPVTSAVYDSSIESFSASNSESTEKARVSFLFAFVRTSPRFFSSIRELYLYGEEVEVIGKSGAYSKIKYKDSKGKQVDAYVMTTFLSFGNSSFKANYAHYHIKKGDSVALSKLFSGQNLNYTVKSGSGIVTISGNSLRATNTGTAVVSASNGVSTVTCKVYVFYRWVNTYSSGGFVNYNWSTKTNKQTALYWGPDTSEARATLPANKAVSVRGDDGGRGGWAYVYTTINGTERHGFVKIEDISTKNTESFYNSLGWEWPTQDKSIHHISSPYAPRSDSTSTSIMHRGADIVNINGGTTGSYVVSPCNGTVKYIRSNTDSCGYCISIRTDDVDPVTGQKIAVIFMHLKELPKDGNGNLIQLGKKVTPNSVIGKIGNTNGGTNSSMGAHLHFEANNKDAGVGDTGRSNFVNTINPLLFYLDMKNIITYNYSASMTDISTYGFYWHYY